MFQGLLHAAALNIASRLGAQRTATCSDEGGTAATAEEENGNMLNIAERRENKSARLSSVCLAVMCPL